MPKLLGPLDRMFQALADPTRRAVLERLGRGPATVSELAQPHAMSLPAFAQHLDVLEACGLVRSRKQGRVRTYRLQPRRLQQAERWLQAQRALWQRRLDQLDQFLQQTKD